MLKEYFDGQTKQNKTLVSEQQINIYWSVAKNKVFKNISFIPI